MSDKKEPEEKPVKYYIALYYKSLITKAIDVEDYETAGKYKILLEKLESKKSV